MQNILHRVVNPYNYKSDGVIAVPVRSSNLWFGTSKGVQIENDYCLIPFVALSQKNMLTRITFQKELVPLGDKN